MRYIFLFFILLPFISFSQNGNGYKLKTVVIDPGHGGRLPGTHGIYVPEKEITLKLSLKVGKLIEENVPDVKVIYTRKTDVHIGLMERAMIANDNKADLFLSIHVNGNDNKKAYGTSSHVMGMNKTAKNLELAKKENSVILLEENYEEKYEGFEPNSSESYIVFSLTMDRYTEHSLTCASFIQDEFKNRARRHDRGVERNPFWVLWATTMPSVLIETGFLTNPKEEKYLMSEQGQDYIASAIYRAFKRYKQDIEAKSNFTLNPSETYTSAEEESHEVVSENTIIKEDDSSIQFKVQVASSSNKIPLDSDFFKGLQNIEEIRVNNLYKYTVGSDNEFDNMVEVKRQVNSLFPDAFVIAVDSTGKVIPIQEALNKLKNSSRSQN